MELSSTQRAARPSREPRINALRVVAMAAIRQNLNLLAISENPEAYATLSAAAASLQVPNRLVVQDDWQGSDDGGVESLGLTLRRRVGRRVG